MIDDMSNTVNDLFQNDQQKDLAFVTILDQLKCDQEVHTERAKQETKMLLALIGMDKSTELKLLTPFKRVFVEINSGLIAENSQLQKEVNQFNSHIGALQQLNVNAKLAEIRYQAQSNTSADLASKLIHYFTCQMDTLSMMFNLMTQYTRLSRLMVL